MINEAVSRLGCPYVYGTWGQTCTVALRKRYANYNPDQRAITYKRCAVLNGSQSTCSGCKYEGMLAYDCRGFTHWCVKQAGIEITGGTVGRQWSDANWDERGDIAAMPDLVCCVFVQKAGKWKHTGLHIGGGRIIHCGGGEVKYDTVSGGDNAWTHYGIPKGLYTPEEIRKAHGGVISVRIMKNGMRGEDVRNVQSMLNQLGFSCGKADGCFGPNTLAAVTAFQEANGLAADGVVGLATMTRLRQLTEGGAQDDGSEQAHQADDQAGAAASGDPDDPDDVLPPADPIAYSDTVRIGREELYEALKIVRELSGRLEAWVE